MKIDDIKIGDCLYAVGPAENPPRASDNLKIYSAVVKNVRLHGSYTDRSTLADLADATIQIELDADRPFLGFPQWIYMSYEIGTKVHLSAAEALRAFAAHAERRRDEAERARNHASAEATWACAQLAQEEG